MGRGKADDLGAGSRAARRAAPVAAATGVLRATVARIVVAVKWLDAARLARKRALAAFNGAFVGIAGGFEALLPDGP